MRITFPVLAAMSMLCVWGAAAQPKPNIIVIMADDLGYGDLSCYGATAIATPNIDRLAEGGIRFTDGYCSASTCTPTRYSFVTGEYAFRKPGTGIAPPNSPALIPAGTQTIASSLKSAGYRTAVVGKWHLGLGTPEAGPDWNGDLKPGPLEIGFDFAYLLPTTPDRVPQVFVENHRVKNLDPNDPLWVGDEPPYPDFPTGLTHRDELRMDWSHGHHDSIHNGISRIGFYTGGNAARFRDEDLADEWVDTSVHWMESSGAEPFFLFFAAHDIHVPRMPNERFQGTSTMGYRGDAIKELDWCVGQIVAAVERMGIADRTLIVFCSDNGPVLDDGYKDGAAEKLGDHRPSGPYKGGKYSVYEGGTRTPFITYWPSMIEPGMSDKMVCTLDLARSLSTLAGATVNEGEFVDSVDALDALLGKPGAEGRKNLVQQPNNPNTALGFRDGNWKLVWHKKKQAFNTNWNRDRVPVPEFQLFDLSVDPGEMNDLADAEPETLARMKAKLDAIMRPQD